MGLSLTRTVDTTNIPITRIWSVIVNPVVDFRAFTSGSRLSPKSYYGSYTPYHDMTYSIESCSSANTSLMMALCSFIIATMPVSQSRLVLIRFIQMSRSHECVGESAHFRSIIFLSLTGSCPDVECDLFHHKGTTFGDSQVTRYFVKEFLENAFLIGDRSKFLMGSNMLVLKINLICRMSFHQYIKKVERAPKQNVGPIYYWGTLYLM